VIDVPRLLLALGIRSKRRGRRWEALCPSPEHDDRHPSWAILDDQQSERHGTHRCLACGFGGRPVDLVVAVLGCSRKEARAWLRAGDYDVPSFEVVVQQREPTRPKLLEGLPPEVRFDAFDRWPPAAQLYLDRRRLGREVVERWGLGYVPAAAKSPLHGRVVIPVREAPGRLRTYQARDYTGRAPTRYLTPSRGPVAILGQEHWPAPTERRAVVVVEGPFDALAAHAAAHEPVAALLGSPVDRNGEPNTWQVNRLVTFKRVVLLTDPDPAGRKAANALLGVLVRWTKVVLVDLPEGSDPAKLWEVDPDFLSRMLSSACE
jgi:DNA primase